VRNRNSRVSAARYGRDEGGRIAVAISQHPREFVAIVLATAATFAIFVNALFLQHGPHPAPIFATRPLLSPQTRVNAPQTAPQVASQAPEAATQTRAQVVSDIQRELARHGFYDGAVDGVWGAKTDAATRDFLAAAGLKLNPDAGDALLRAIATSNIKASAGGNAAAPPHNDPIAELIAPTQRVLAVQRALADYGYGQIKPTGVAGPDTQAAISKFERDHRLPVTGQISDALVRELSAMTGRPLE
jgi:peptidoglycan hydrolase-like protein with peptidoglycan-binding domain